MYSCFPLIPMLIVTTTIAEHLRDPAQKTKDTQFLELHSSPYYVDKTLLIKLVLALQRPTYVTAPRRTGKTVNLSMLKAFYETEVAEDGSRVQKENSKNYAAFRHIFEKSERKADTIFYYKNFFELYFGTRPVIYLSFRDIEVTSLSDFTNSLRGIVRAMVEPHRYLLNSDKLESYAKEYVSEWLNPNSNVSTANLLFVGQRLSEYLKSHFGQSTFVLIDDVDAPILKMISQLERPDESMMRYVNLFLGKLFKDNENVYRTLMTGSVRLPDSLLLHANNIEHFSQPAPREFASFFGLLDFEVQDLVNKTDSPIPYETLSDFYNGYNVKHPELRLFNTFSVTECLKHKKLGVYWSDTGNIQFLSRALQYVPMRQAVYDVYCDVPVQILLPAKRITFENMVRAKNILDVKITAQDDLTLADVAMLLQFLWEMGYLTWYKGDYDTGVWLKIPSIEIKLRFREQLRFALKNYNHVWDTNVDSYKVALRNLDGTNETCYNFALAVYDIHNNAQRLPENDAEFALPFRIYSYDDYSLESVIEAEKTLKKRTDLMVVQDQVKGSKIRGEIFAFKKWEEGRKKEDPLQQILNRNYSELFQTGKSLKKYSVEDYVLVGMCYCTHEKIEFGFLYNSTNAHEAIRFSLEFKKKRKN